MNNIRTITDLYFYSTMNMPYDNGIAKKTLSHRMCLRTRRRSCIVACSVFFSLILFTISLLRVFRKSSVSRSVGAGGGVGKERNGKEEGTAIERMFYFTYTRSFPFYVCSPLQSMYVCMYFVPMQSVYCCISPYQLHLHTYNTYVQSTWWMYLAYGNIFEDYETINLTLNQ